jgi:hypothetical protein
VCELPGYLRGLCFAGSYALVGLSKIREKHIFGGLPIQQRYQQLLCGVAVVDTRSGKQIGLFEYTAGCEEIYDIQFLPGVYRPTILNLDKPAVRQAITNADSCFWLRPSSQSATESASDRGTGQNPLPSASAGEEVGQTPPMGNLLPDSGKQL